MPNRAFLYHDESDARTRDVCCPPLSHCLIRPPDPRDDRVLLTNPFAHPEHFGGDVAAACARWRKRFGSGSPEPGKILVPPERIATPHEDEVEYAEWVAREQIEGAYASGREDDPAVARAIAEATGIPVEDIVVERGRIDLLDGAMGGAFASMESWAKTLTEEQVDRIKALLRLGQKWTLRKIQKAEDPEERRALAAELVASLESPQREGIRRALTDAQRRGFADLTGVNL